MRVLQLSIFMLVMEMLGMGGMSSIKALRTLRALRPLRAVSRWEGMRVSENLRPAPPALHCTFTPRVPCLCCSCPSS